MFLHFRNLLFYFSFTGYEQGNTGYWTLIITQWLPKLFAKAYSVNNDTDATIKIFTSTVLSLIFFLTNSSTIM